jgi:hypothetical protein
MSSVDDCRIISFKRISRPQGNLTPIENLRDVPFEIQRVYYLYDVPGGESRGGHAHRLLEQVIISAMGSFAVDVDDGCCSRRFYLNRAYYGLYIAKMIWREILDFSSGGICLVMASRSYEESDYIRDYDEFLKLKKSHDPIS